MTSYKIHGKKGLCGESVDVKVWGNGISVKCNKIKEFKKSTVIYSASVTPEKAIKHLCGRCSERGRQP